MSSPNKPLLHGVLPVLHTPLSEAGGIDADILHREIDWALDTGADGVVIAMVSEILRLGYQGRKELAQLVCEAVAGRGFVVISVGAESTAEALDFAKHAESLGATAVMAIPPIATALGNAATRDYFAAIADSISIPLVVQDASSYVGAAIDLGVYLELLERFGSERIYFKPEASPLGPNLSKLRDATAGQARIFEGSGGINLVDCYRRGISMGFWPLKSICSRSEGSCATRCNCNPLVGNSIPKRRRKLTAYSLSCKQPCRCPIRRPTFDIAFWLG